MIILAIIASFIMFALILILGIAIGYALGYKNEKTLKQQVSKLRETVKRNNKSAQLTELTIAELKQRDDWDFRNRLAAISGQPVTAPDNANPLDDDPQSMARTF